jgi:hypothetical protein
MTFVQVELQGLVPLRGLGLGLIWSDVNIGV